MAEVRIDRVFEAPREEVFAAWTHPDRVAAWYGPGGMEVPADRVRIDAHVGGRWEVTMVRPDGGAIPIGYEIIELDEPGLLVLRSDPMPEMGMTEPTVVRVELSDEGGKTRLVLTDGPMPESGAGPAEAGYTAALDKLAALLIG